MSIDTELVTVIVCVFNAEETIEETLESILKQTYKNIELVISDDCSTDSSSDIYNTWVNKHTSEFVRIKTCKTPCNAGVVANLNNALRHATGKYIKAISADDIMLNNCIEDNLNYLRSHSFGILFSKVGFIGDREFIEERRLPEIYERLYRYLRISDLEKRRRNLIINFGFPTTSLFFSYETFKREFGEFDIRFPFWEDGPFFYKMLANDVTFGFMDKETTLYRVERKSMSNAYNNSNMVSYGSFMSLRDYVNAFFILRVPLLFREKMYVRILRDFRGMIKPIIRYLSLRAGYGSKYLRKYKNTEETIKK